MMLARCCAVLIFLPAILAAEWALLVAGSNGYYNYRHQSDICHAYQVLIANNFPADHIITMMYDDIANNEENPVKGNLINRPDGPNVYEGCVKDYTKDEVNPKNFLKILSGEEMQGVGSGRTVQSTKDDNVFVFFSDHGATGLIAFPNDELYADDLHTTIKSMHSNKQYKQLLFYLEACESGSMFNGILESSLDVLAVTASDPTHSSYAIYFDEKRQTYLGDVFSVNWMQDAESNNPSSESVGEQFKTIRTETNTSRVCAYGDTSIKQDMLAKYIGSGGSTAAGALPRGRVANSRDIMRLYLEQKVRSAFDLSAQTAAVAELHSLIKAQHQTDLRMHTLSLRMLGRNATVVADAVRERVTGDLCTENSVQDFDCLKQAVTGWKEHCEPLNDYSLKYVMVLNEMCRATNPENIVDALKITCARI